jgi:transcriptional regulator GlxA family with amidase domain
MLRDVVTVAYPGVTTFGLGVTAEVFGSGQATGGLPRFRYQVAGTRRGELRTDTGLRFRADTGLGALATADLAIVVCWKYPEQLPPPALLRALRATVAGGGRVMSHCTGAFVLAAAGLLDGRRAATHWTDAAELARRYPAVRVEPDVLYIDEGPVLTSAGCAAGIDLCLHVIRTEFGAQAANALARRMVVPPYRDGGQSQYRQDTAPVPARPASPVAALTDWMLEHLHDPLTVSLLAQRASMSPRTFARQFLASTGTTPHAWLLAQRLLRAQALLEDDGIPVEQVARQCGLSPPALRRHFGRRFGSNPAAYRKTFHGP